MKGEYGWSGKVLRVNLTDRSIISEPTFEKYGEKYIGGVGMGYKVMWDEVSPDVLPFDPENKMVFAASPLTGTEAPTSARALVVSKSPQVYPQPLSTHSAFGGPWSPELKFAGYDAIIIEGKADSPVYIWIHDEEVEIREAAWLWGLDSFVTQQEIKKELGDLQIKVICIGPAGENLVRFACILHETGHAAGQGGFGAVMGSKNLKAIAVRGKGGVKVARPEEFMQVCAQANSLLTMTGGNPKSMSWVKGIDPRLTSLHEHHRRYSMIEMLAPELAEYAKGRVGCCPNKCYDYIDIPARASGMMMCIQYFYTIVGCDGEVAFLAKDMADKYAINAFELYFMIPWLRALHSEGIISEKDSGIPFSAFPKEEFISTLLRKIVYREGFGDILAEGIARAAEHLGVLQHLLKKEFIEFCVLPPERVIAFNSYGGHGFCGHYDARNYIVDGLLWAMHSRDPHNDQHDYINLMFWSGLDYEEQKEIAKVIFGSEKAIHPIGKPKYDEHEARAAIIVQNRSFVKDSLTLCDWAWPMLISPFVERTPPYIGDTSLESRLFSTATGIELSEGELLRVGERNYNLARAVMAKESGGKELSIIHDNLPDHIFENPNPATLSPPVDRNKFEDLKKKYYNLRGWDEKTGLPTKKKLRELDLGDVVSVIENNSIKD